jgi:predicted aspartyl protease
MIHQAMHVTVNVGGAPIDMIVDTGASVTSINEWLANQLLAYGQAREYAPWMVGQADGSSVMERRIVVSSLILGSHTCTNVLMTVAPDGAPMLLGLPVLNSIGRLTIDANSNRLIFG